MRCVVCVVLVALSLSGQQSPELARHAVAAHKRGDLATAIAEYRELLKNQPGLVNMRTNLAAALAQSGHLDDAIAVLEAAPASDRGNPAVMRALALAHYQKHDLASALPELEKLHASDPKDLDVIAMLADCYTQSDQSGKAIDLLSGAVREHPGNDVLRYQLGVALIRGGKPEPGIEALEEAARSGKNADGWVLAGATALNLGQFQRAREDLEMGVRLNPNLPGAWTWTGTARDRLSDEEGAKEAFRKALGADPQDAEAMLHLGAILYRERDLTSARKYIEGALALQPSSTPVRYAMALVRSAMGEPEKAVEDLQAVVAAAPNWVEPHVKLASLYFRLKRQQDGLREKQIVEALRSEHKEQQVDVPAFEK